MALPHWLVRFLTDFKRKQFWALKALYFLIFGGMFTLYPFLTIHARSLGITEREIGAIYGVMPILGLFAPALAGMLADKIGNFKVLMSFTFAVGGLSGLIFLAVPTARITYQIPDKVPIAVNCSEEGYNLAINASYICNHTQNDFVEAEVTKCEFKCASQRLVPLDYIESSWCNVTKECRPETRNSSSNTLETKPDDSGAPGVTVNITWVGGNSSHSIMSLTEEFCPDFSKIFPEKARYNSPFNGFADDDQSCWMQCSGYALRKDFCSNNISTIEIDPPLTLGVYLLVRIFNGITLAMSIPLLEGATVAILKEHKGDFGFQRLYINLGMIVMTPISGLLMDVVSGPTSTDYRPAFFLYCGMNSLSALAILFVDLKFKKPANNVLRDFLILIFQPKIMAYLLVNLISGISIGLIDTFLFWLLDDMGADKSLMGITVMVGAFFGIPMLIASAPILEKLGHVNTICLGMAFYVVRLTGYSVITDPWWAMPFEALESFTVSLLAVASVSYAAVLSSPSTMTSLQGMQAGIVHGVGRGAGSLMGGFLSVSLGIRRTFQMMAIVCGVTVVIYGLVNRLFFERVNPNVKGGGKEGKETANSAGEVPKDVKVDCEKNPGTIRDQDAKKDSKSPKDGDSKTTKNQEILKDADLSSKNEDSFKDKIEKNSIGNEKYHSNDEK